MQDNFNRFHLKFGILRYANNYIDILFLQNIFFPASPG